MSIRIGGLTMSSCHECKDFVPVHKAVEKGMISAADANKARNDIHGFNAFCQCEGFVNTCRKDDDGCLCFLSKANAKVH
ncbi:MAG: hypothetical protein HQL42_07655 [Alphaproteobacteria bacterium]|nr:hypothetical protein [Alphaproteobacteria bacterium]